MCLRSSVAVAVPQAGSCSSESTPSLGISICHMGSPKKKKDKKKIHFSRAVSLFLLTTSNQILAIIVPLEN